MLQIGVSNPNVPIFPPMVCTLVLFISLVFIKKFWEKLFSTGVVERGIERLIVAISKGRVRFDQGG